MRAVLFTQGLLFIDRMTPAMLDSVRGPVVALEQAYVAANPGKKIKRIDAPKTKGF